MGRSALPSADINAPSCIAIDLIGHGGPEMLGLGRIDMPVAQPDELLIRVHAAGINRGDAVQRKGNYPPPPGASAILGLEVAGEVVGIGSDVSGWKPGDRVCALMGGGGYAAFATAKAAQCFPVPSGLSMTEAAALPEAIMTVWANIFADHQLKVPGTILIHGGTSGIGIMAIQMAKAAGARVVTTAGSDDKCAICRDFGADLAINYRTQDFVAQAKAFTGQAGVDTILDMVGGDYIQRNMDAAADRAVIINIAFLNGNIAQVNFSPIMAKRLVLTGSRLRGRDNDEKAALAAQARERVWPWIEQGLVKPLVAATFPLANAADAHRLLDAGGHSGKIVLELD